MTTPPSPLDSESSSQLPPPPPGDASMASLPGPSSPGRRLAELLQEQQEPFLLDVYLLEHGCSGRSLLCPDAAATCWPAGGACRRLQRLASHGFGRQREGVLGCLFAAFTHQRSPKASTLGGQALRCGGLSSSVGEARFTKTGLTWSSSAGVDAGELGKIKFDVEGTTHGWEYAEEAKQLSPVSVLEVKSDEGSPANEHIKEKEASTTGLCLPVGDLAVFGEFHGSTSAEYTRKRKELHGRRQPPLAREVEGAQEEERSYPREQRDGQHSHEKLGSQVTEKGRRRQVCAWSRRAGDDQIALAMELIASEASNCGSRWNQFHPLVREIGAEIGDAILQELIEDCLTYMTELSVLTPAL